MSGESFEIARRCNTPCCTTVRAGGAVRGRTVNLLIRTLIEHRELAAQSLFAFFKCRVCGLVVLLKSASI
jgi:hypothetical protein